MYRQRFPDDPGLHNMQGETFNRVSYRHNPNFFERVRDSLFAILVGLVLIVVACVLLFWNEGRAVQTAQSLEEGLEVVVPLSSTEVAFEKNNGQLVYLSGFLKVNQGVYDPDYKIQLKAAKLRRTVEMYQWVEHESKREVNEGDRTREEISYSYSTEWRQEHIRSDSFYNTVGHENPSSLPISTQTLVANSVQVGAFFLSTALLDQINDFRPLAPSTLPDLHIPSLKYHLERYYQSENPQYPKVGDIRIKFEYAGLPQDSNLGFPTEVSIVAKQLDSRQLASYQTLAGDELEILYTSRLSPKEIFSKKLADNSLLTWAIRFGGWVVMFVAFGCLTNIVKTLVDWVPIVRELVAMGLAMLNAALSISLSLTVIALGWIRYRPLLGCGILVLAMTPFLLTKLRKSPVSNSRYRSA